MCTCLNNKHFGSWITNVFVLFSSTETWEKAPHWNERCGHENFSLMCQSGSAVTLVCYHWISHSWTLLQENIRFCHYVSKPYLYRNRMPGLCLHIYSASVYEVCELHLFGWKFFIFLFDFLKLNSNVYIFENFWLETFFFFENLTTEQWGLPNLKLQYS